MHVPVSILNVKQRLVRCITGVAVKRGLVLVSLENLIYILRTPYVLPQCHRSGACSLGEKLPGLAIIVVKVGGTDSFARTYAATESVVAVNYLESASLLDLN